MEPILPPEYERALRYIDLVDRGGATLTNRQVDAFIDLVPPVGAARGRAEEVARPDGHAAGHAAYFGQVGWLAPEAAGGRRLTPLGRALLRGVASASPPGTEPLSPLARDEEDFVDPEVVIPRRGFFEAH